MQAWQLAPAGSAGVSGLAASIGRRPAAGVTVRGDCYLVGEAGMQPGGGAGGTKTTMGRQFRVTGIKTEPSANGTHDHVAAIRQGTNPQLINRTVVAADLRDPDGDRYYIETPDRLDVVVVACPICSAEDYLRTTADRTTADTLLAQPRI